VACGLAIYVVVGAKSPVSAVKVGPAEISYGPLAAQGKDKLKDVAEEVKNGAAPPKVIAPPAPARDDEIKELEKLAQDQPDTSSAGPTDIVGSWRDHMGAQVQITSLGGNVLTYNETSNFYGVPLQTAAGQGTWTNGRFEFTFNTAYGATGVAVLQPVQGNLVGEASIPMTGTKIPLSLTR
jgi:hypothetical protein